LRHEIRGLRARRLTTPAAQALSLESRIDHLNGRVDVIAGYGIDHLAILEAFALDAAADREAAVLQLSERADDLSGRLHLSVQRMTTLKAASREDPGNADLKLSMAATKLALDSDARSLGVTLDLMDRLNLPTAAARGRLVAVTRDVSSGILDPEVSATLVRQAWQELRAWSHTHVRRYGVKAGVLAIILLVGRLLSVLVRKAVDKSLRRAKFHISVLLRRTLVSAAQAGVFVIAVTIALSQLGISLGPMLAGLGVAGFIVGFALQDSLSNFAAGMMILVYRPYDVGDQVEVAGILGKVQHMSMVSTTVLTLDNQKLVVPNNKIWGDVIKNVTDQNVRRVDMVFSISYTDDVARAEAVLKGILEGHERVLAQPEPIVRLHKLADSSVDFVVRPWVKTEDYWDVYWDVTRAVKMRFDEERITIPFPQRDVHVRAVPDGEAGSSPALPA
jgi:small conductance mechanosensitive channel